MKMVKKISSVFMAIAIIMLATVTAFAANSQVESEVLSHDFEAYQVFKATGVDGKYLTDVDWGTGFPNTRSISRFLTALTSSNDFVVSGKNIFNGCNDADSVARVLSDYTDNSDVVKAFAKCVAGCATTAYKNGKTYKNGDTIEEAGYYLFTDTADSGAINPTIIKMAADSKVKIEVKASVPQVEKKVKENTYNYNYESKTIGTETATGFTGVDYGAGYNDAADYNIGDSIPFELIGTMASTLDDFDEYYYAFEDTLSKGLTYSEADKNNTTVTLYDYNAATDTYTRISDVTDYFTISSSKDKTTGETLLTVACNDILQIPRIKSSSVLFVNYNATLNDDAVIGYEGNINDVYLEYSNNPDTPTSKGKTEKDKVIVFTYAVDVTKYDTDDNTLEGAKFYLQNANGDYYSSTAGNGSYWVKNKADAELISSDANGNFVIYGLDKGEYTLTEAEAPSGFQVLANGIEFEIKAKILPDKSNDDAQNWTTTAKDALLEFAAELLTNQDNAVTSFEVSQVKDATVYMEIVNTKVYDLPGTGGMGTTLIYIIGGALVACAVVLIVVKRKSAK